MVSGWSHRVESTQVLSAAGCEAFETGVVADTRNIGFVDADTRTVEPIVASVAADHEPRSSALSAHAVDLFVVVVAHGAILDAPLQPLYTQVEAQEMVRTT